MTVKAWIEDFRVDGVTLWLDSDSLHYRYEGKQIPSAALDKLKTQKSEIIRYLKVLRAKNAEGLRELTNLQQAYWVGEKSAFSCSTQAMVHLVFKTPYLNEERLCQSVCAVMRRHPPLRMLINTIGDPEIGSATAPKIDVIYTQQNDGGCHSVIENAQDLLLPLERGPPFKLILVRQKESNHLHALLRLIAFDATSVSIFMDGIAAAYEDVNLCEQWSEPSSVYARLAESLAKKGRSSAFKKSRDYWQKRIPSMRAAPQLPLALEGRKEVSFRRHHGRLSTQKWNRLQAIAAEQGCSINSVLCQIYACALQRWSQSQDFTLNVMFSQRYLVNQQIGQGIGNFSSTLLLAVNSGGSFYDQVVRLQARLFEAMEMNAFDGVAVLRSIASKLEGTDAGQPLMPFVFSTQIESGQKDEPFHKSVGWTMTDSSMQTPQVWLDHQVYEVDGELGFNFDEVEGVFPNGMIADVFCYYESLLDLFAGDRAAWSSDKPPALPSSFLTARNAANRTDQEIGEHTLHNGLWKWARTAPSKDAICHMDSLWSFQKLADAANHLAAQLIEKGVEVGDHVLVGGPKTPEAIAALYAVLSAGAVYVPVSEQMPQNRVLGIVEHADIKVALTNTPRIKSALTQAGIAVIDHHKSLAQMKSGQPTTAPLRDVDPGNVAYVIYTSGSTGQPKGVVISHRAAANTIIDVIDRFKITPDDRLLGVSELTFDLSVFDVFALSHGGTALVLPEDNSLTDPGAWIAAADKYGATIWNSVPAIMQLALNYQCGPTGSKALNHRKGEALDSLRVFMASGDWIPLDLPGRLAELLPKSEFFSLGGATEASIWSNYFNVKKVDAKWKSIPYGYPLANQRFHILDGDLEPVPPGVVGHLFIAGDGVAEGYLNDPKRTSKSFFVASSIGERIYRTGDLGRYDHQGCMEFMGRRDFQVKINGHRIELGEIEKTLQKFDPIDQAVVVVSGAGENASLVAVVTWAQDRDEEGAQKISAANLPKYMVPSRIVSVDAFPLTSNGKVDAKALKALAEQRPISVGSKVVRPAKTKVEKQLRSCWEKVLGVPVPSVDHEFFSLGGDSIKTVHLLNELMQNFDQPITLEQLYQNSNIKDQAEFFEKNQHKNGSVLVAFGEEDEAKPLLYMLHPVGGAVMCYHGLAQVLTDQVQLVGVAAAPDMSLNTVHDLAEYYSNEIIAHANSRDIMLGGWSMGGVLALDVARQLEEKGTSVSQTFTIDSWVSTDPEKEQQVSDGQLALGFVADFAGLADDNLESYTRLEAGWKESPKKVLSWARSEGYIPSDIGDELVSSRFDLFSRNYKALLGHKVVWPKSTLSIFTATAHCREMMGLAPLTEIWPNVSRVEKTVDADHFTIISQAATNGVVSSLRETCDEFLEER